MQITLLVLKLISYALLISYETEVCIHSQNLPKIKFFEVLFFAIFDNLFCENEMKRTSFQAQIEQFSIIKHNLRWIMFSKSEKTLNFILRKF